MLQMTSLFLFALLAVGCGLNEDIGAAKLQIILTADNTQPEGATGTSSPKSIEATIVNAYWTLTSETEIQDLFEAESEKVTIINRERIIVEKDIKDLKGESFSNLTVQLALEMDALGKYEIIPLTFEPTLMGGSTLDLSIAGPIEFQEGKDVVATIRCQWYRTRESDDAAQTDTITNPNFDFTITSN